MLFHVSIHFFTLNLLSLLQKLKLSHEHQGFTFEPDATKSADLLVEHSGGKVSKALKMAIEQNDIIQINNEFAPADYAIETSEDSKVVCWQSNGERNGRGVKKEIIWLFELLLKENFNCGARAHYSCSKESNYCNNNLY